MNSHGREVFEPQDYAKTLHNSTTAQSTDCWPPSACLGRVHANFGRKKFNFTYTHTHTQCVGKQILVFHLSKNLENIHSAFVTVWSVRGNTPKYFGKI